jgi:hypothetical protein
MCAPQIAKDSSQVVVGSDETRNQKMLAGAASQEAVCLIKGGVHRIALLENTAKSKNRQSGS